ncbi:hypothetical protein [Pseudomonas putida]|uniref:hypothetical protein n=1 Tax=Pseudomonas putida TaxID=303 RepID=UPI0037FD6700
MQLISQWTPYTTPDGRFRYGSAVGGQPPTPIKAEWLNVIQAELANFILAYLPALKVDDNEQLLKAARLMIANLATKATTLAGYSIGDAYTKSQVDGLLSSKANWGITLGAYGIGDAYTKTSVDMLLSTKADKATTLAGYGIIDPVWTDLNATPKAIVAQASAEVGGVGTYALLLVGGSASGDYAPVPAGTLVAGSSCLYTNCAASSSAGVPAGTWKVMGALYNRDGSQPDSATLCLRVS